MTEVCVQVVFLTLLLCLPSLPYPQVVCGSKYLVRGESALDHVDLLVSSRHWPPVYVVDMATPVALCADLCYPELTNQMWGRNQGCFSSPTEPPVVSSLLRNWSESHRPATSQPLVLWKALVGTISSIFFLHQYFVSMLWNHHLLHTFLLSDPCVCSRPQHVISVPRVSQTQVSWGQRGGLLDRPRKLSSLRDIMHADI